MLELLLFFFLKGLTGEGDYTFLLCQCHYIFVQFCKWLLQTKIIIVRVSLCYTGVPHGVAGAYGGF